jgi:hypothetical protein
MLVEFKDCEFVVLVNDERGKMRVYTKVLRKIAVAINGRFNIPEPVEVIMDKDYSTIECRIDIVNGDTLYHFHPRYCAKEGDIIKMYSSSDKTM